jgi:cobalt transporter subunit CbtB
MPAGKAPNREGSAQPLKPQVRRPAASERASAFIFEHTEGGALMTTQRISAVSFSLPQRLLGGLSVLMFGAFLLFGVGLSHSERLHNAAHDTRHAIGFPCH